MTTLDQTDEFAAIARMLSQQPGGDDLLVNDIYVEWWQKRHEGEDLIAIQRAAHQYESGERGTLAREELATHRAERAAGTNG
jgi:hypothetical protein